MRNIDKYKKDLGNLIAYGIKLEFGLYAENYEYFKSHYPTRMPKKKPENWNQFLFSENYENWYSEALRVIKQLLPERLDGFMLLYKGNVNHRSKLNYENYCIHDYLIGLIIQDVYGHSKVTPQWCLGKFRNQLKIFSSIEKRFESSLFDIRALTQADVFDSELDSARELCRCGFYRAAGAICGVVLEKHLKEVALSNNLSLKKKTPAINDYNQLLKDNNLIDVGTWRYIQRLGDLRNLCDHDKEREPKKEEILDLIDGTDRMIKEL